MRRSSRLKFRKTVWRDSETFRRTKTSGQSTEKTRDRRRRAFFFFFYSVPARTRGDRSNIFQTVNTGSAIETRFRRERRRRGERANGTNVEWSVRRYRALWRYTDFGRKGRETRRDRRYRRRLREKRVRAFRDGRKNRSAGSTIETWPFAWSFSRTPELRAARYILYVTSVRVRRTE